MITSRVIPSEDMDILQDASDILASIYKRASDLEELVQSSMRDAQERGYEAGRQEALADVGQRLSQAVAAADAKLLELDTRITDVVIRSMAMILGEIPSDEQIRRIVRAAIRQNRAALSLSLHVCPYELDYMREVLTGIDERITIQPDIYVESGEIVLEVDAQRQQIGLADQLANLLEAMGRG